MTWRMASFEFRRASQFELFPLGRAMFMPTTWSGSNPSAVWVRAMNDFMAAPAPAINRSVSATWPAISSRWVLRLRALPECLELLD